MIAYPILNFALPLMLSSFILVDNPSRCSECHNKTEHKVGANAVIERIPEIDTEVNTEESSVVTAGKDAKSKKHKDADKKYFISGRKDHQ